MSRRHILQDPTGVIISEPTVGHLLCAGPTVPSDGEVGYAPSCIWIDYDATGAAAFYVNIGTYASCNFDLISSALAVTDANSYWTTDTVEAALDQIGLQFHSAQKFLNIPIGSFTEADGTVLAAFSDGVSNTPGLTCAAELFGIRWNNAAQPDPIGVSIPLPPDLDDSEDVVLHVSYCKIGGTAGDTINWTVTAFFQVVGALHDADADCGGEMAAATNTTKLVQEGTLTLAAANVGAHPGMLHLTIQPKDGELGTDDVILMGAWLEYTGKLLTS